MVPEPDQLPANWQARAIKCRASYDVLEERNKLQLDIHCASESYSFDLRGSATLHRHVRGRPVDEWTREAAGIPSGKD